MAYCNIEDRFLGKKLNSMFYEGNRNTLANIIATSQFKDWFGEGRKDVDGNPVIDETLSFTNAKGEKKTVFDFEPIMFENTGEVKKLLKTSPAVRQHDGELFINNTKRDMTGQLSARWTKSTIDVINYYYPNLLRVATYTRKGSSEYSKDRGIPLNIIRVTDSPLVKTGNIFSFHEADVQPRKGLSQVYPIDELEAWKNVIDEFRANGISQSQLQQISDKPEVSEATYDRLLDFLKKINPDFKVEELENLGANGIAYIQDFLIQVDVKGKFKAMPEEVSHFFVEMLPDGHPLKKELLDNITNFPIYSATYQAYKGKKEYQTESGKPDFEKIKREAAAKLIGEFVYAIAEGDNSRIDALTKTKQGWIAKWWEKIMNFFRGAFNLQKDEAFKAYVETANKILTGDIEYLSQEQIANNAKNDVFFQVNDINRMEMAQRILASVNKAGKTEELQKVIHSFRNELRTNWNRIIREKGLEKLNTELMKEEGHDTGVNYLAELYDVMKSIDITESQVENMMSADSQVIKFSEFIDTVMNMNRMAKAIHTIVKSYDNVDNYEMNITELQSFRRIYENFRLIITKDLATVLSDSDVSFDIINQLRNTANEFDTIELEILKKLRQNIVQLFKEKIAPQNTHILSTLTQELEGAISRKIGDKYTPQLGARVTQFRVDVESGKTLKEARRRLISGLVDDGVNKKDIEGPIIERIYNSMVSLYTPDKAIQDLVDGTGTDIDTMSASSHWVTAAIKNKDVFVSNVAKYIVDRRTDASNAAQVAARSYAAKVDPILKRLRAAGLDEYQSGEAITYIDQIYDRQNKDMRDIVKFLSPTTNAINLEKDRLFNEKNDLRRLWLTDRNSTAGKAAREDFVKSRKVYIQFLEDHYNSPYKQELRDFQTKWNQNDDFLDIKERWDALAEQVRHFRAQVQENVHDQDAFDQMLMTEKLQKNLLKEDNIDGTPKTGKDLEETKLLRQFFDEGGKFRIEDVRRTERNYRLALNNYAAKISYAIENFRKQPDRSPEKLEEMLRLEMRDPRISIARRYRYAAQDEDLDLDPNSIETAAEISYVMGNILLERWEERNTVKVKNQLYFDTQKGLYELIEQLKEGKGVSVLDITVAELSKRLYDLVTDRKDFFGQRNPDFMTEVERQEVMQLEDTIAQLREFNVKTHQVLPEVKARLSKNDQEMIDDYEKLVEELNDYQTGKKVFNSEKVRALKEDIHGANKIIEMWLSKEQKDLSTAIRALHREVAALTERKPTYSYWDRMERLPEILDQYKSNLLEIIDKAPKGSVQAVKAEKDIANLTYLSASLEDAIYNSNYEALDQIINDEMTIQVPTQVGAATTFVSIDLKFKQYVNESIGVTGDSVLDEIDDSFMYWFRNIAHKSGGTFVQERDENDMPIPDAVRFQKRDFVRRLYYVASEPTSDRLYDEKRAHRFRATRLDPQWEEKQVGWKDAEDMEDWTTTNKESRREMLPLSRKQLRAQGKTGEKYDKFLNKKFYDVQDGKDDKSAALRDYLKVTMKTYLSEQDTKPDELKSFFNYPVIALDHFQSDAAWINNAPDRVKRIGQRIGEFFGKKNESTDAEDQLDDVLQKKDIDEETGEQIIGRNNRVARPVLGMNSKLSVERVNRNALAGMLMYISNSKDFDARVDLDPLVNALIDVMKANETVGRMGQKERAKIFDKIYSQMILQELPDNVTNQAWFRKMANGMMHLTALKLQGDIIGGAVNYIQANLNNLTEAFAGKHVTMGDYRVGYAKAGEMMGNFASDYFKKSDLSFWTLMYQHFDFVQGEWLEDLEERTSQKGKTFNFRKMLMYPRKNGELHAQSALAIAILNHTKVKNSIDGKEYPMWEIYVKDGDELKLKEGFDEAKYNAKTGTEFIFIKNKIHGINLDLHGNYSKFNQTEASRHSIGKIAENMKRWFVPGFQRRFGREFYDVSLQDIEEGYYRTGFNFIKDMLKAVIVGQTGEVKDYWDWYMKSPRQKYALRRAAADLGSAALLWMIYSFAFGYDDDDKDRNKKMRESSWVRNWGLIIFLRASAEQTAYIPFPPFGFTEMARNLLDPFSVAKGAVTNVVALSITALYTAGYYLGDMTGIEYLKQLENETIYSRNTGSKFGKKGDLKILNYFMKTIGYTGAQLDPAYYLKNYEQLQNRLK